MGNSDAHRIVGYGGTGIALVVADGLGSAAAAAFAAQTSVTAAARRLETLLSDHAAPSSLDEQHRHTLATVAVARGALFGVSDVLSIPRGDLGTTLLLCVVSDKGVTFGGVGDGFLAVRASSGTGEHRYHLLTIEAPGRLANETGTLASSQSILVESIVDPWIDGLALASDGFEASAIERPAAPDRRLRPGVIDELLRHADVADGSERLQADVAASTWDASTADDRTIVIAVR